MISCLSYPIMNDYTHKSIMRLLTYKFLLLQYSRIYQFFVFLFSRNIRTPVILYNKFLCLSIMRIFKNSVKKYIFHCPGPDNDLSINFFFAKHSHHLLGLPSSPYTFSTSLTPVSCLICCKYCLIVSMDIKEKEQFLFT